MIRLLLLIFAALTVGAWVHGVYTAPSGCTRSLNYSQACNSGYLAVVM